MMILLTLLGKRSTVILLGLVHRYCPTSQHNYYYSLDTSAWQTSKNDVPVTLKLSKLPTSAMPNKDNKITSRNMTIRYINTLSDKVQIRK